MIQCKNKGYPTKMPAKSIELTDVTYSDNTPDLTFARNIIGSITNVNNATGITHRYAVNDRQAVTNEILQLDSYVFTTERALDPHNRPTMTTLHLTNELQTSKSYAYDNENRLAQLIFTNSLGRSCTATYCYAGSHETDMAVTLSNGNTFTRSLTRDTNRPTLVTRHDYAFNGTPFVWYACNHDTLGRVTNAYDSLSIVSAFLYNTRSEVINVVVGTNTTAYLYNSIGGRILSSKNNESTAYTANNLNQYTQISVPSAPLREPLYDVDGNMLSDGTFTYSWDAENRMSSAMPINPIEGNKRLLFRYDWKHRVTQLNIESCHSSAWVPHETRTFIWDGWLLLSEIVERADSTKQTFEYFWGNDLSGSEQGAGGVGGLIAVCVDGFYHLPCYDHNGNITAYVSESGTLSAQYRYDAFGNTLEQSGSLSDTFRHRFSTKYFIPTLHAYYYGYRLYLPRSGCWFNRDPIEEKGGLNLYGFLGNNSVSSFDYLGELSYDGKSKSVDFFYKFTVNKCEVAIIYGHGHASLPHEISYEDIGTSSAYFWGCYPDITNCMIPLENRLVEDVGSHEITKDDEIFDRLKILQEIAVNRAKSICETDCCPNGVWIKYQFSPHNSVWGRMLDGLKGFSSHNKPKDLIGGGRWKGNTHVPCNKK